MNRKYSHLIWLGANTATEPANLLSCAQQVTLFEARAAACLALQKQHSEPNIAVINALVTATNQTVNFTEYNLLELSATQPASGLTKLFPGLKAQKSELQNSLAITDAISKLSLADDNNLLVVDILDSNLTLLKALETSNHLSSFKTIYIQAPQEPLYTGAAGHEEIVAFMQTQGYLPQTIISSDPDLPWLSFIINPLWKTLQQTQQKNRELETDQAKIKSQLNAAQEEFLGNQKALDQKNLESTKQLQSLEQKISEQKQQLIDTNKQKQETEQQLATVKQQLSAAQQALTASNQKLTEMQNELTKANQSVNQATANLKLELEAAKNKYEEISLKAKKDIEEKELALKAKENILLEKEKLNNELRKELEEKDKKNLIQMDNEKKLKQKLNEQEYRNNNLNQEVTKLAAQIDLITNVVLKEKVF